MNYEDILTTGLLFLKFGLLLEAVFAVFVGLYAILLLSFKVLFYEYFRHQRNLNILRDGQEYFEEIYISDKMLDTVDYKKLEEYDVVYHNYRKDIRKNQRHCKDVGEFPRYYKNNDGKLVKEGLLNHQVWIEPSYGILKNKVIRYITRPLYCNLSD